MLRPTTNRSAIFSKSAPNLDKTRNALTRPTHDIGNHNNNNNNNTTTPTTDSNKCSGLQLLYNKFSSLTAISELKKLRYPLRNNSFSTNNASLIPKTGLVGQNNRLSKSIGNISHYDTVFSTNSFVIAKGVSNSVDDFTREYDNVDNSKNHDDTDHLLNQNI